MASVDPKGQIARELGRIFRLWRSRACPLLSTIGLYRGQHFVIEALSQADGMTQSQLAAVVSVRPATMTHMSRHMEAAGLIERRPDDRDQRVSRVFLMQAGQAAHEQLGKLWQRIGEDAFAGFTEEECSMLRDFLRRVRANLLRDEPARVVSAPMAPKEE